ncbi:MAG TPA: hypothetical protein DCR93_34765 [Cytophagales bacterium]|nr:hypothetical protein [Cytophagales bacterium]HAP64432.1 hypothetical protein [Cytophagales bacterium]
MELKKGIVCSLTNEYATFEGECADFKPEPSTSPPSLVQDNRPPVVQEVDSRYETIQALPEETLKHLREHQDFTYAVIGGALGVLVSALLWAVVTVVADAQIGYMALAVGIIVAFGVRLFGAGVDAKFGYLGAGLAVLGCLLGNLFAQVVFIAEEVNIAFIQAFQLLNAELIADIFIETFSPIDLLFYGLAGWEGLKFSLRKVPETATTLEDLVPPLSKVRLPMTIGAVVLMGGLVWVLTSGSNEAKITTYDDGSSSQGQLTAGYPDGEWSYNFPDGTIAIKGTYNRGREEGTWYTLYPNGKFQEVSEYRKGQLHGWTVTYYENGTIADSTHYRYGRKNGYSLSFYEDGTLGMTGGFYNDEMTGEWTHYQPDGTLLSQASYDPEVKMGEIMYYHPNGEKAREVNQLPNGEEQILNSWNPDGVSEVVAGEGTYYEYGENKGILAEGQVTRGMPTGRWTYYYPDGSKSMESHYEGGEKYLDNAWSQGGNSTVTKGYGSVFDYLEGSLMLAATYPFAHGQIEGTMNQYYPENGELLITAEYKAGKQEGSYTAYYPNGLESIIGRFENGKEVGVFTWYHGNGEKQSEATFKDGKKEGVQTFWNDLGLLVREEIWEGGKLVEVN